MAIVPDTLFTECQTHLGDAPTAGSGATWDETDMLEYINNGLFECLKLRPNMFSVIEADQLVAGTIQTLPNASDYMLLDVIRNMGADGATVGRVINSIDRWQLDMFNQAWHKGTGKTRTLHYSYEPQKSLSTYFIFPPPLSTSLHYIQLNVARPHSKIHRTD